MAITFPRPRHDVILISTSELSRLLNIPESRMARAIRDGQISPLGKIGPSTIIALTEEEIEDLRRQLRQ